MVSAPQTLSPTKAKFATAWNKTFGNAEASFRLGAWASFFDSGDYHGYAAPIPETGVEDDAWAIDYKAGPMTSVAL